jgi:hypothetical protein
VSADLLARIPKSMRAVARALIVFVLMASSGCATLQVKSNRPSNAVASCIAQQWEPFNLVLRGNNIVFRAHIPLLLKDGLPLPGCSYALGLTPEDVDL